MQSAPRGLRLHIGIYGRRNVGKSSLLNAITRQQTAIVADFAGTTTDPVEKPMEMLPLGPVVFIDTAGIDDEGEIGALRVEKSMAAFARTEVALIVVAEQGWSAFEDQLWDECVRREIPFVVIANKTDLWKPDETLRQRCAEAKVALVETIAASGEGVGQVREALIALAPAEFIDPPSILGDLVPAGGVVVFVVPIDLEAPKGRLIMPQVQSIRDTLDNDAWCLVVKERELSDAIARLRTPPDLVVCDSQAFLKVAADVPDEIPMTSFSILFARFKGDLPTLAAGAMAIDDLDPGSRLLMAESCTHHPIGDDIGRVKIPRWLTQYVGGKLDISMSAGKDFPEDLNAYDLVVHCGSCTTNRRTVLSRMLACREANIPITNYGCAIAYSLGIFPRALRPFPAALDACGMT